MRPTSHQFVLFMFNGGVIGLLCWALQLGIYSAAGVSGTSGYWFSALLASAIGIIINYQIQRRLIFARKGNFWLFAAAATAVSIAVSFAAVAGRQWLGLFFEPPIATRFGYAVGALAIAPLSCVIKKFLIFRG